MRILPLALAVALMTTACSVDPVVQLKAERAIKVSGVVHVVSAKDYSLKDLPSAVDSQPRVPFELRRLDHMDVYIQDVEDEGAEHQAGQLIFHGEGDADHTFDPVILSNLKPYRHYNVRIEAFQFDPAVGNIIQVDDNAAGASVTSFDTFDGTTSLTDAATESVILPAGFRLKLRDQDFNGQINGGLATESNGLSVHDGVLNGPGAPEVLIPPAPPL